MSIDLVAWGDDINGLSLRAKKSSDSSTALAFRYSDPIKYAGPLLMEVYRDTSQDNKSEVPITAEDREMESQPLAPIIDTVPDPEAKGLALELEKRRKEKPGLVALVPLPKSGSQRTTVLLAPQKNGTFSAYVINDDPTKLRLGQIRIHNLSPHAIALRLSSDKNKQLKPGEHLTFSPSKPQLIYELAYQKNDAWVIQENNIIPVRKNEQTQLIVLKSNNSFFLSSDGSKGGYLQSVILRRSPSSE